MPKLWPCSHCGAERIVAPIDLMIGLDRRHPLPGLGAALSELATYAGSTAMAAICPGCMCLTTDLYGC